jgi:hypothetical protein
MLKTIFKHPWRETMKNLTKALIAVFFASTMLFAQATQKDSTTTNSNSSGAINNITVLATTDSATILQVTFYLFTGKTLEGFGSILVRDNTINHYVLISPIGVTMININTIMGLSYSKITLESFQKQLEQAQKKEKFSL